MSNANSDPSRPVHLVWLVEDDPIYRMMERKLVQTAYPQSHIQEFENGQQPLKKLEEPGAHEERPDLILLDLNMSVVSGWDFLEKIHPFTHSKQPDILVVTSSIDAFDREKALSYPTVKGFLSKPIKAEDIII